jgi:hypothetical protein
LAQVETKVIDFHLEGCIVEQKCKINISGRTNLFYLSIDFLKVGRKEGTGSNLFCLV